MYRHQRIAHLFVLCTILALATAGAAAAQTAGEGETCSGIGAIQCEAGLVCDFAPGCETFPDQAGTCVAVPAECPQQGPRVCGCDGVTYRNDCERLKAGARLAKQGACGNTQGTQRSVTCRSDRDCEVDRFCQFKVGTCGDRGAGRCTDRPDACTLIFDPVCGCDGTTYGNACEAARAGVSVQAEGECPAGEGLELNPGR